MSYGITEEDRRKMRQMSNALKEGSMGPTNVDEETCANWRRLASRDRIINADLAAVSDYPENTVAYHVRGDCSHGGVA